MSINKLALIRYQVIDSCLRNTGRYWTLDDLIKKVSDVLFEKEGIRDGVSRRTIQGDIQVMRSNQLGYNAPIEVVRKKYYVYKDPKYSITQSPISATDMETITEMLDVLRQMSGFNYLSSMGESVLRLEQSLSGSKSTIHLESNEKLKGLEFLQVLSKCIQKKQTLMIHYKSFKSEIGTKEIYYPYLLKEYRNRWFLVCRRKGQKSLYNLALDRMIDVYEISNENFEEYTGIGFERYFSEVIGVTRSEKDRAVKVILEFNKENAPYILTKPLHGSQQVLKVNDDGSLLIRIDVILNFELEREILSFGENVVVKGPQKLLKSIKRRVSKMGVLYKNTQ